MSKVYRVQYRRSGLRKWVETGTGSFALRIEAIRALRVARKGEKANPHWLTRVYRLVRVREVLEVLDV